MSVPASWSVLFASGAACWLFSWGCAWTLDRRDRRTASYAAWRAAVTKKG